MAELNKKRDRVVKSHSTGTYLQIINQDQITQTVRVYHVSCDYYNWRVPS